MHESVNTLLKLESRGNWQQKPQIWFLVWQRGILKSGNLTQVKEPLKWLGTGGTSYFGRPGACGMGNGSLKVCKILSWTRIPSSSLCSQNIGSFLHPQRQSLLLERTSYCISGLRDMRTAEEMDEPFNWIWSDSVKICILNSKSPNSLPLLAPKKSHMHPRSYPPSLQPAWGIRL